MMDNIFYAVEKNDLEKVKEYLKNGVDINSVNALGNDTPLIMAIYFKHHEIVEYLIKHGADIEHRSGWGKTALMYAASENSIESIHCLLKHGADIEAKDNYGWTPLMWASTTDNNLNAFKVLLEAGANSSASANNGESVYMLAKQRLCKGIMELIEKDYQKNFSEQKKLEKTIDDQSNLISSHALKI